jgi:hypothetical protein
MMRINQIHKSFYFILLNLVVTSGYSQTNIINKTLIFPDSNVLFLGITNSIEIINNKNPFFEIRAAKSSLTATPQPFIFEIQPTHPGWDTISILDGGNVSFRKAFKIDFLPAPEARLGTLRTGEATSEQITINGWLVLIIPNCKCTTPFTVTSFEVSFGSDEIDEKPIAIEGDRLTVKAKKIIRSLKAGDEVYFDHIVAKNEMGRSIDLPGLTMIVKGDE